MMLLQYAKIVKKNPKQQASIALNQITTGENKELKLGLMSI